MSKNLTNLKNSPQRHRGHRDTLIVNGGFEITRPTRLLAVNAGFRTKKQPIPDKPE